MVAPLDWQQWNAHSSAQREGLARQIAEQSRGRFRFDRLQRQACGNVRLEVAEFTAGDKRFVFVPGGSFELGFDPDGFRPSHGQHESYRSTADEYEMKESLVEYVMQRTTPLRTAAIGPLLVETVAHEIGILPIPLDTPAVHEVIRRQTIEHGEVAKWGYEEYRALRVTHVGDGEYEAYAIVPVAHAEFTAELMSEGFRLPSSDEWEFLCGGSSRTLFRWGDDCPCDRYPTDISLEESLWRKMWVISGGTLDPPHQPFERDWNLHVLPNALGLSIATNPYHLEVVSEPKLWRGGDGGSMICGGAGFFLGWLTIATAFLERDRGEYWGDDVSLQYARRVFAVES